MPNTSFRTTWNLIILFLLIYTSTVVPYQVAFSDDTSEVDKDHLMEFFTITVDFLFGVDIVVNFFAAYEVVNNRYETRLRKIAANYLQGYFLIDWMATIPVD